MSLNTPSNAPHLADLASELDRFSTLLEQEAAALGSGTADALAPLIAQREAMNRRLASLWQALLDSVGLPAGAALATVRERCGGEAWHQVEQQLQRTERMNRLNSRLIDEQLRRTQAAVQVLQSAAGNRTLYGADGRMSDFSNLNRTIDTA